MTGFVSLVGAGPGDPDLLTRRALTRLEQAEIVFHDGLVPDAIVALASAAKHVSVARRAGPKTETQRAVNQRLIACARAGRRVVRLKCGDPFVFGRGGEEASALADAGVPFEIVPGLTTATAAPALAGIPVTERGLSSVLVVVSGHDVSAYAPAIDHLVPGTATIVILMGLARRCEIRCRLLAAGWAPTTPVAIVTNASWSDQKVWRGSVQTMASGGEAPARSPGVIVIGAVAERTYGCSR